MSDYFGFGGSGQSIASSANYHDLRIYQQQLLANAQMQQQAFQAITPLNNKNEVDSNEKLLLLIED